MNMINDNVLFFRTFCSIYFEILFRRMSHIMTVTIELILILFLRITCLSHPLSKVEKKMFSTKLLTTVQNTDYYGFTLRVLCQTLI